MVSLVQSGAPVSLRTSAVLNTIAENDQFRGRIPWWPGYGMKFLEAERSLAERSQLATPFTYPGDRPQPRPLQRHEDAFRVP